MSRARILIVEDDLMSAEIISTSLINAGYRVVGRVASGEEAVLIAEAVRPDLILMDIRLEGEMDGIDTAARITSRLDTAVLYLTAHVDKSLFERAKATEPYAYLTKPAHTQELLRTVDVALYKHSMEKRLKESEERFRRLSEAAFEGIAIHDRGTILDVNHALAEMLGFEPAELIGVHITHFLVPESRELVMTKLSECDETAYELQGLRKDGTTLWMEFRDSSIQHSGRAVSITAIRDIDERKKWEETLRTSENKYRRIFETIQDVYYEVDMAGTILEISPSVEQVLGYSRHELIGTSMLDLNSFPEQARELWASLADEGEIHDHEISVRRKDGIGATCSVSAGLVWDEPSNTLKSCGVLRNIASRKRAEEALRLAKDELERRVEERTANLVSANRQLQADIASRRSVEKSLEESESRYRHMFENMKSGVAVYEAIHEGEDFRFKDVNPGAERISKVRREELLGKRLLEVLPDMKRFGLLSALQSVHATGDPIYLPANYYQDEIRQGWRENYIYRLPSGEIVVIYDDITDRKEAEKALRESEERFRAIFEQAAVGVAQIDSQSGRFVRINKRYCDIVGYTFDEMEQMNFQQITHPEDLQPELDNLRRLLEGEIREFAMQKRYYRKDGKIVWVNLTVSPLWQETEEPSYCIAVVEDITREKAYEDELKLSEQRFRAIFESVTEPIFLKDVSLRYILVNSAMASLLGLKEREVIGCTDDDLFDQDIVELLHDSDERVLAGQVVEQESARTILGERMVLLEVKMPLLDGNNAVVGICGIIHDITRRRPMQPVQLSKPSLIKSQVMRSTMEAALRAGEFDTSVLLTGETGAGKDYLAKIIHEHSKRSGGPYFCVNCASLAPELAESELFGHEAGAFTSARTRKRGMLELAEGGTLFLNEVGELSLVLQAKLLTFLDTRQFLRVGGERPVSVNARLIAATNRDLQKEVAAGRFRSDLFFRLNVYHIEVPPLRDRIEDLPTIARSILTSLAAELQLIAVPTLSPTVLEKLSQYEWPGNVRELRNVLERALILSGGGPLIPHWIVLPETTKEMTQDIFPIPTDKTLNEVVSALKRTLVLSAITRCGGNKTEAARFLGIPRSSLINYLKD